MKDFRDFYSKILLFGEYSVICNSMGLTIPYRKYSGKFQKNDNHDEESQRSSESLYGFYEYLLKSSEQKELLASMDLSSFKADLENNLYFNSNIPQGYGVGSSGAICAATYDRYCNNKLIINESKSLAELKQVFAQMESYFHGVSSGLDPLNSYLKKPLLINDKETITTIDKPNGLNSDKLVTFLVDTGMSGETEHLVNIFFDKCRHYKFYKEIKNKLIPLNNKCITLYMDGDLNAFLTEVNKLSKFFYEHFKPMIPLTFRELWEKGISGSTYTLKLCGSGGGGFLLGFTKDFETTKKEFPGFTLLKIEV